MARPLYVMRKRVSSKLRKMGSFFSSNPKSKSDPTTAGHISDADKAVLSLKVQRDKLTQYQKQIKNLITREVDIAKEHLAAGDRKRALLCLRKKKYQEQLLEKTDAQLLNLQNLINTVEFASIQKQVLDGIKAGNDALKALNDQMKLDDIEKLKEDTEDAIAYQQEVDAMLSKQLSSSDDQDVSDELDRILEEQSAALADHLPNVPNTTLETPAADEIETEVPSSANQPSKKRTALQAAT